MAGATVTAFIGYRLVWHCDAPVLGMRFDLPTNSRIDAQLILGAALFGLALGIGVGCGIGGFCPGPA